MASWILGLCFRDAAGRCVEEPWQFLDRDSLPHALAAARRDGVAGEFGRTFLGVATVEDFASAEPWDTRPIDAGRAPSRAGLDRRIAEAGIDEAEFVEPPLAAASPPELESVRFWEHRCAFGPGTLAGVLLRRSLAAEEEDAAEWANVAGESLAHQSSLYPVTPHAIPALLALLERAAPEPRAVLGEWLDVIARAAAEVGDDEQPDPDELRRRFREGGTPDFLIEGLVAGELAHVEAARACRARLAERLELFGRLADAEVVGRGARKLLRELRRPWRRK